MSRWRIEKENVMMITGQKNLVHKQSDPCCLYIYNLTCYNFSKAKKSFITKLMIILLK